MGRSKIQTGMEALHAYETGLNDWCGAIQSRLINGLNGLTSGDGETARREEREMQQQRLGVILESVGVIQENVDGSVPFRPGVVESAQDRIKDAIEEVESSLQL